MSEESEFEESENEKSESEEDEESEFEPRAKRPKCSIYEVGIMHHLVSYSSSVSTFCQNEIKDRNYKSVVQQHILISFQEKNGCHPFPLCSLSFSLQIFH